MKGYLSVMINPGDDDPCTHFGLHYDLGLKLCDGVQAKWLQSMPLYKCKDY